MQVKKQPLEPDMKQLIGSKLGKEYDKTVYCHPCHPAYLTYSGIICISEVIDISAGSLDSHLWFIQPSILHDVLCIEIK